MKRIKEKDGRPWCKFCPEKTTRAVWRSSGCALSTHACEDHKDALASHEAARRDDGHMSEGDYQSWGRL